MNPTKRQKRLFLFAGVPVFLLIVLTLFIWKRRPPVTDLTTIAPAETLVYVEMDSLPDTYHALASTRFWTDIRPAMGFPDQFLTVANSLDWVRALELGPDDAVVLGRAQVALAVTEIRLESGAEASGELTIRPRGTLFVKTHTSPGRVERLIENRSDLMARKVFGPRAVSESLRIDPFPVRRLGVPGSDKSLFVTSRDDLLILANDEGALRLSLEALQGRRPPLSTDPRLARARAACAIESPVLFAFVQPRGVGRLAEIGLPAGTGSASDLVGKAVENLCDGLGFSAAVTEGHVLERSAVLLAPDVAAALERALPVTNRPLQSVALLPPNVASATTLTARNPAGLTEILVQTISARTNVAVGFALRQLLLSVRERYGIGPRDSLDHLVGDEISFVELRPNAPRVWLVEASDRVRLLPILDRYLKTGGATISTVNVAGIDLACSSHPDGRAVGFIGDFLAIGKREELEVLCRSRGQGGSTTFTTWRETTPEKPPLLRSVESDREELDAMVLALARLAHAGDATPARLTDPRIRGVLDQLPRATATTTLTPEGIITDSHSALGLFARLAALIEPEPEVIPTVTGTAGE